MPRYYHLRICKSIYWEVEKPRPANPKRQSMAGRCDFCPLRRFKGYQSLPASDGEIAKHNQENQECNG